MNVGGGPAIPPMRRQHNPYGVADQRRATPVRASPPTSARARQSREAPEYRARGPAPMTRWSSGSSAYKDAGPDRWWISVIPLATCAMLGLTSLIASADEASRLGYSYDKSSVFFWSGLILTFVPIATRALMRNTSRAERLGLVIILGVALYIVKILASPLEFTFTDEFIHLRNTQDILRTQHIFGFNPLLPTAAYYPGLAAVTAGLVNLTGLSTFISGLLVIATARVLISACFFLVAERVTGSSRAAAAASLVYVTNPMFLFWSATFSYENLALPLAAFVVWWLGRTRAQASRLVPMVTVMAIVAVTVTHHVVGFALTALLGTWWIADRIFRRTDSRQHSIGLMTVAAGSTTLIWFFFVARPAASYLLDKNILPALQQTGSMLVGHGALRHLYTSGGYVSPRWETVAGFAATGLLLLALPPSLFLAWRTWFRGTGSGQRKRLRGRAPMAIAMAAATAYPFSLIPRLTTDGVGISGRSSEYVFLGLGCILGLLVDESLYWRHGESRYRAIGTMFVGWRMTLVATGVVTVIFIGNITVGTAFYQRLPEQSNPQGYPWLVQTDVIYASIWAREHLGINQRFGANANDALALATYGGQLTIPENDVWPIFFAGTLNETVVRSIRSAGVRYLLVDWRMTKGIPATPGYYFSPQEPQARDYKKPFPAAALRKFAAFTCIHLIYHSKEIQILDISRIENGSCVPSPARTSQNRLASS